jgi:hypothetical protein
MFNRCLETEANEILGDVYKELLQAGVDKMQPEKEAKLKELAKTLPRFVNFHSFSLVAANFIFVLLGARRRVVDLCKPTQ